MCSQFRNNDKRYFRDIGSDFKLIVNDQVVSYTDVGPDDAPVIIFIHSFLLNKNMWNSQLEALKNNYRVISYDIRGHGDSDPGISTYSIELFVSDLLGFMDALKIEKVSLCGLSMGGYIVLNAIENYPERFDAIVLSDTNCKADTDKMKQKRISTIESIREKEFENYFDESILNLIGPEYLSTKEVDLTVVKDMIVTFSKQSFIKTIFALCVRKETCSLLFKINVPVLILVGEEDKISSPASSMFLHEKIKNSILHSIINAGHLSNLENPQDFNNQLIIFFDSVYKKYERKLQIIESSDAMS